MKWYWLSFADATGNLGVVILAVNENAIEFIDTLDDTDRIDLLRERGQDEDVWFYTAVQIATLSGLNPGGEVRGWDVTDHIDEIPEQFRNRLVRPAELAEAGL